MKIRSIRDKLVKTPRLQLNPIPQRTRWRAKKKGHVTAASHVLQKPRRSRSCLNLLLDASAYDAAPLGPEAIVVADVAASQKLGQNELGVGGTLADPAIGDDLFAAVDPFTAAVGLQVIGRLESAILGPQPVLKERWPRWGWVRHAGRLPKEGSRGPETRRCTRRAPSRQPARYSPY